MKRRICIENAEYTAPECGRLMPVMPDSLAGSEPIRPYFPQLFPSTTVCLHCKEDLVSDFKQEHGDHLVVHSHSHGPLDANAYKRTCGHCGTVHHYSYYEVPGHLHARTCYLNADSLSKPYLLLWSSGGGGSNHALSMQLLDAHLANVVHGHITFNATVMAYNETFTPDGKSQLDDHSLTESFFALGILRYLSAFQLLPYVDISPLIGRDSRRRSMDNFILSFLPVIRAAFSRWWSLHRYREKKKNPPLFRACTELAIVAVDARLVEKLRSGESLNEFVHQLMPQVCFLPPADCDIYGCGDPICSTVAVVDGHMKNNRPTCSRDQAIVRHSPELGVLRLQCPRPPGYQNGRRMNVCDSCFQVYGLHEPGQFAVAEAPPQVRQKTSEEECSADVTDSTHELSVQKKQLVGCLFKIPPEDHEEAAVSDVFIVRDVANVMITDDTCPEGKIMSIVYYYDRSSKRVPGSNTKCDWSSLEEVSDWVKAFDQTENASASSSTPPLTVEAPSAETSPQHIPVPLRRSRRITAKSIDDLDLQESSLRQAGVRGVCFEGPKLLAEDNVAEETVFAQEETGPKRNRASSVSFVFERIIAETSDPAGQKWYTCEYAAKGNQKKLIAHLSSQVSSEAVADFKMRLREKPFAYSEGEAELRRQMCGNNDKELLHIEQLRSHSAGVGACLTNCGIWLDIYELLGKEGCTQVLSLALSRYKNSIIHLVHK